MSKIHLGVSDHLKVSFELIFFLETSVCAEISQHCHGNQKVYLFYDQIAQEISFGEHIWIFVGFCLFGFFHH